MSNKYVRALPYIVGSAVNENAIILKFMYEFWGYCVNGGSSLTTPGGFPGVTFTGGSLPAGFTEGSSVVVTGSDGSTTAGSSVFSATSSTPFNSTMIGKYLVIWVPNSGQTDDSIYQITAVPANNTVVINPNNGGTPNGSTLHPSFLSRTNIKYRVVDVIGASGISGVVPGNFIVFQFNSSAINTGQANGQVQVILRQTTSPFSGSSMQSFGLVGSPSGSWTGSTFTGTPTTTTITGQNFPLSNATLNVISTQGFPGSGTLLVGSTNVTFTGITNTSFTGCNSGGTGAIGVSTVTMNSYVDTMSEQNSTSQSFLGSSSSGQQGFITIIGDSDFLLLHVASSGSHGSIIHIETPFRLYPQGNDPNPFTIMVDGQEGFNTESTRGNYNNGFALIGTDFTTREHDILVKSLTGDGDYTFGLVGGTVPGIQLSNATIGFNVYNGTAISSECLLSTSSTATQFCLSRCKLKNVRIAGTYIPSYHKIGNSGQFLHLQSGVCWPWDNTILPFNLMPGGL